MDLRKLWEQDMQYAFANVLEDQDLGLVADHSDWVYVDGEEGDFGIIRYKDATGQVVAVRDIKGGDSESIELTEYGKPLVAGKMLEVFKRTLSEKLNLAPDTL